jgi:thiol-disulfide isomerase/thioredoxin
MKKIYVIILLVLMGVNLNAQCPLTTAVDFTATDIHGQTHNLFSYLNAGKYVLIDFFYTTCGPCQQTAPKIQGAYEHFGCNSSNVIFLSIDRGDDNTQVSQFDDTYGIHCPSISGVEGGGTAINTTYGISAFPTVILIAPDKTIIEQDIWPIADAAYLIGVITGRGGIPATCSSGLNESNKSEQSSLLKIYPNPATNITSLTLNLHKKSSIKVQIFNVLGEKVMDLPISILERGSHSIQLPLNQLNNGSYFVQIYDENKIIAREKLMKAE